VKNLLEQRAIMDALFECLGDGVLAVDATRTILVANASARRMFNGVEVGKGLPSNWPTLHRSMRQDGTPLAPEDGALGRGLRGERTDDLMFTLQPEGSAGSIWVEATGRPVLGANGEVIAAVGVYRDATERKRQTDLYATLARNIPRSAVILFDRDLRCLAVDGEMARASGLVPASMIGQTIRALAGFSEGDEQFDRIEDAYRRALAGESVTIDLDHRERILALHAAPVRDDLGHVSAGIVLASDVTAERRVAAALRRSDQVYRAIVQNLPNGAVFMVDRDLRYVTADGPIVADMMRRAGLDGLVGRSVTDVVSTANGEVILDVYRSTLAGQHRHLEVTRGDRFYDLNLVPIFDGSVVSHALVFLYDVTDRKSELAALEAARVILERNAGDLQKASVTDELTGLLNRRGLTRIAEQEMLVAARTDRNLLLFFVDVNGMKKINDTLGHQMGDRALVDTGHLLRKVFRTSDAVARLGGDEFVVLVTDASATSGPALAVRLRDALAEYNASQSSPFHLSLSSGVSLFDPSKPSTLGWLLSDADARMYEEKRARRLSVHPR
jgi:diguanylate cyclase (GGDEF)-like protein